MHSSQPYSRICWSSRYPQESLQPSRCSWYCIIRKPSLSVALLKLKSIDAVATSQYGFITPATVCYQSVWTSSMHGSMHRCYPYWSWSEELHWDLFSTVGGTFCSIISSSRPLIFWQNALMHNSSNFATTSLMIEAIFLLNYAWIFTYQKWLLKCVSSYKF